MNCLIKSLLFIKVILLGIALFRAQFMFQPKTNFKDSETKHSHGYIKLKNDPTILKRFIAALNIPTISYKPHLYNADKMLELINHLETSYPSLHNSSKVQREIVSNYSLLYTIQGSDDSLEPYMLTCHLDVVPAIPEKWSTDPFNASVKEDGFIYGRGTIDAKHLTISIFEAIDHLFRNGFQPKRSLFLAFGHDEEVLGQEGAQEIARIIKRRLQRRSNKYDKLLFIIDEGNIISKSRFPGVPYDVAFIGVAEKGYLSLNVSVAGEVGHGSMPNTHTAISKLSKVIGRFNNNCLNSRIGYGFERKIFETLASYSTWPMKLVYANFWLFKPLVEHLFSQHPALNGIIRSTTAVTLIEGGTKENMLPDSASAIINQRIHETQNVAEILELDRKLIDDPNVDMKVSFACEPTPIAPHCDSCNGYQLVRRSLMQVYPDTITVPSAFLATTDSKWFGNLTDSLYRFSAVSVELEEMKSFHGHDERLSVANYERLINFYHRLILNSDHQVFEMITPNRDEL